MMIFQKHEKFNITMLHKIGGFSLVFNNIMRGFSEYWIYSVQLSKRKSIPMVNKSPLYDKLLKK